MYKDHIEVHITLPLKTFWWNQSWLQYLGECEDKVKQYYTTSHEYHQICSLIDQQSFLLCLTSDWNVCVCWFAMKRRDSDLSEPDVLNQSNQDSSTGNGAFPCTETDQMSGQLITRDTVLLCVCVCDLMCLHAVVSAYTRVVPSQELHLYWRLLLFLERCRKVRDSWLGGKNGNTGWTENTRVHWELNQRPPQSPATAEILLWWKI